MTLKLYLENRGKSLLEFHSGAAKGWMHKGTRFKETLDCGRLNTVIVCFRADQTCDWYTQHWGCITPACRRSTTGSMTVETGLDTFNLTSPCLC